MRCGKGVRGDRMVGGPRWGAPGLQLSWCGLPRLNISVCWCAAMQEEDDDYYEDDDSDDDD